LRISAALRVRATSGLTFRLSRCLDHSTAEGAAVVGVRIPSTMRSDRACAAGHRAALRLMPLHLLTGVGLLLAVLSAQTIEGIHLIGIGGAAVFLVVAVTTGRGGRQGREGGGG